jgi:hypothetical protein
MIPGGRGEAIELGKVPARVRAGCRGEIEGEARRLRPRMVLRSRREYHDSGANGTRISASHWRITTFVEHL